MLFIYIQVYPFNLNCLIIEHQQLPVKQLLQNFLQDDNIFHQNTQHLSPNILNQDLHPFFQLQSRLELYIPKTTLFSYNIKKIMPLLQSSSSSPSRSSSPTPVKLEALIILPNGSPVSIQSENSASQQDQGRQGHWDRNENLNFMVFLSYYQSIFSSPSKRKNSKVFKALAQYLSHRSAAQCRSHFQKLLIKHKTVAKIKKYYRQFYGEILFQQALRNFEREWEKTHLPATQYTASIKEFREYGVQTQEENLVKMEVINSDVDVVRKDCACLRTEQLPIKYEECSTQEFFRFFYSTTS